MALPVLGFLGSLFVGISASIFRNIDLTRISLMFFRISFIIFIFSVIISFLGNFNEAIKVAISNMFNGGYAINNLNLGYIPNAIGLVDFINNVIISVYFAVSFYGSVMISIMVFKFITKIYTFALKV